MHITQISVFLENKAGTLRELTEILGREKINLLALSLADTSGFGIARFIVRSSDNEHAAAVLKQNGFIAKTNRVVCIRIPHKPMSLAAILALLEQNGLSVEYTYSFCQSTLSDAVIIIRPSDCTKCEAVLDEGGIKTVSQEEVDTF